VRGRQIDDTFRELSNALAASDEGARVQITVRRGAEPRSWSLDLEKHAATPTPKRGPKPDLEIVVQESTWWEIAEGRLSPPDAFRMGRLRIRGDANLGMRLYKVVAGEDGSTELCLG
jgi:putative sterol carrier protein